MGEQDLVAELKEAEVNLYWAYATFIRDTTPQTPRPRPRTFVIAPGLAIVPGEHLFIEIDGQRHPALSFSLHSVIYEKCGGDRQRLIRALRRLDAVSRWCQRRAKGRRRMAEEVKKQQKRYQEALEAEAAVLALVSGRVQDTPNSVIAAALSELWREARRLVKATGSTKAVPLKRITIARGIYWPCNSNLEAMWIERWQGEIGITNPALLHEINLACKWQPRRLWIALSKIRRATAKCIAIRKAIEEGSHYDHDTGAGSGTA